MDHAYAWGPCCNNIAHLISQHEITALRSAVSFHEAVTARCPIAAARNAVFAAQWSPLVCNKEDHKASQDCKAHQLKQHCTSVRPVKG
eukprot:4902361-Amphidinium_carterae.2